MYTGKLALVLPLVAFQKGLPRQGAQCSLRSPWQAARVGVTPQVEMSLSCATLMPLQIAAAAVLCPACAWIHLHHLRCDSNLRARQQASEAEWQADK